MCPYRFYLKYILFPGKKTKDMFFASYGSFMHELLEAFYKGEKDTPELRLEYLVDFRTKVKAGAPSIKVFQNYFEDGIRYLKTLQKPAEKILAVETKIDLALNGVPFVGYIDLIEENEASQILLTDNKSRALKPRSTRAEPTKSDMELDEYLKQLYLYSAYARERYGKFPSKLCFNCFRKGLVIREEFDEAAYNAATDWFFKNIEAISEETDFRPDIEYFKCRYLCEMQDFCDYYELSRRR